MGNIKIILFIFLSTLCVCVCKAEEQANSLRKERNFIREGNKQYEESKYRDAEVAYKKALEINPSSEIAKYNLASSLMKQSGSAQADSPNNPIVQSDSIFNDLVQNGQNRKVVENSYYNLGNIAFDKQDYGKSISMYKGALRINPDNDNARENLRLAQLKLREQQQNKDNNKDKDNNKQENKDQKDQNKDKNKDQQNQDKNKQDKKDENQDNNQDQQQQPQSQDKQKQQTQGISEANAEKILKTMENEENATRRKVNAMKKKEAEKNASRRQITNQW